MPDKKTIEKAEQDKQEGKAPSTQAGEYRACLTALPQALDGEYSSTGADEPAGDGESLARAIPTAALPHARRVAMCRKVEV